VDVREVLLHGEAVVDTLGPHLKLLHQLLATLLGRGLAMRTVRTPEGLVVLAGLGRLVCTADELELPVLLLFLHLADQSFQLTVLLA
jgi:hypothetical protein